MLVLLCVCVFHVFSTLWLFNIAMEAMAPIEIEGLPINSMVIFHGYVKITRWYLFLVFVGRLMSFV